MKNTRSGYPSPEKILKELSSVKKSISDIRKSSVKSANVLSNTSFLNELANSQRNLTQRLTLIEYGEMSYDIDVEEVEEILNNFLDVKTLDEILVSQLIQRIEVGEIVTTENGPKRDIILTYSFEKKW